MMNYWHWDYRRSHGFDKVIKKITVKDLKEGEIFWFKENEGGLDYFYDGNLKYHTRLINQFDHVFENNKIEVFVKRLENAK